MKRITKILALLVICCSVFALFSCKEKSGPVMDLTKLSDTMINAQVQAINERPDEFVGRTVRISGMYDKLGGYYDAIVLYADPTGCCTIALEFVLAEGETYPTRGSNATVEGRLEIYYEESNRYCHLVDAKIV